MLQTERMPDDIHPLGAPDYRPRPVTVTVSADGLAARRAELPTRKEIYRVALLGVATGACLLFRG
jgi:hypothetical protein